MTWQTELLARNKNGFFKKNMNQQLKRKINGSTLLFKIQNNLFTTYISKL